jgi:hypothetical protein
MRWPFDADLLRNLPIAHVKAMGRAHLTACPDGEGDKPFCGDLKADHTVVHHPILGGKTVEAMPLDILDRTKDLAVLGRNRLVALET